MLCLAALPIYWAFWSTNRFVWDDPSLHMVCTAIPPRSAGAHWYPRIIFAVTRLESNSLPAAAAGPGCLHLECTLWKPPLICSCSCTAPNDSCVKQSLEHLGWASRGFWLQRLPFATAIIINYCLSEGIIEGLEKHFFHKETILCSCEHIPHGQTWCIHASWNFTICILSVMDTS